MNLHELKSEIYKAWFRFDKAGESLPDRDEFLPQSGKYTGMAEHYYATAVNRYHDLLFLLQKTEEELEIHIQEEHHE